MLTKSSHGLAKGGGRYTIGRREKWPEKVGRREKLERKCWEEGENKMLGVGRSGEISMRRQFFYGGTGNLAYTAIPFGLLGLLGFLG